MTSLMAFDGVQPLTAAAVGAEPKLVRDPARQAAMRAFTASRKTGVAPGLPARSAGITPPTNVVDASGAPAQGPAPAAISTFGPGSDLRSTQIAPGSFAPRVGDYAPSGAAGLAREAAVRAFQQMQNGPDRGAIARDQFGAISEDLDRAETSGIRRIGQNAARLGRVGAGMTTSELGDLGSEIARHRTTAARDISLDTAGRVMDDRARVLGAAGGLAGQFRGEDLADAGFRFGLDQADFGRGGVMRDELRGERAYQEGSAQQAFQNRLAGTGLLHGMNMDQLGMLERIGFGQDPSWQMIQSAGQMGGDNGAANLLAAWSARRAAAGGGQPPAQPPITAPRMQLPAAATPVMPRIPSSSVPALPRPSRISL